MPNSTGARAPAPRRADRRLTLLIYGVIAALSLFALWPLVESERRASAGREAAARGDFAAALEAWLPLAEDGNAEAQFSVGVLHDRGLGTREDPAVAVTWYRRAAEQGAHAAQVNLGLMLVQGRGVAADPVEAAAWFAAAANANVPEGLVNLGHLHRLGHGVARDPVRAYGLLRRAALLGNATAAVGVAEMLAAGEGVDTDAAEALAWARLAVRDNGPAAARAGRLATELAASLEDGERRRAEALAAELARGLAR